MQQLVVSEEKGQWSVSMNKARRPSDRNICQICKPEKAQTNIYMYVYVCIYICIYIYTYVYIYQCAKLGFFFTGPRGSGP